MDHDEDIKQFIASSITYLKSLKDRNHISILQSPRKTGFNGLIVCLKSIGRLFDNTVKTKQLNFILSYKISQDHIEMLFSAIRSRGGFNNNPTAAQFEAAYKRLLVRSELSISENANCSAQDNTSILHVSSNKKKMVENFHDVLCVEEESFVDKDEDNKLEDINVYKEDVTEHISGFVVKQIKKIINCHICCNALEDSTRQYSLIDIKNRGELIKPSIDITRICKITEKIFTSRIIEVPKHLEDPIQFLMLKTMAHINITNVFNCLNEHILTQSPINNHLLQIIKLIIKKYLTIRLHHHNKELSQPKSRIRTHLTKMILFKHQ